MVSGVGGVLSPTRALRQPRRVDGRAVVGAFLTVISVLGSLVFWSSTTTTRGVVVATRDRPAGAQLTADDLTVAQVRLEEGMYRAAVPGAELRDLVGKQLAEPVHAHQVLVRAQVGNRPALGADEVTMTIPIGAEVVAGSRLQPGDQVQVLATVKGMARAETEIVLPRATVYDVGYGGRGGSVSGGASSSPGGQVALTLVLTQEQAIKLARARREGEVDVLRLPPGSATEGAAQRP